MYEQPTVLLVDDDEGVLTSLCSLAEGLSVTVMAAQSAEEALMRIGAVAPSLVVTDYSMGKMNGWDLILNLRQRWPGLPCVLFTGSPVQPEMLTSEVRLLKKPPTLKDVGWLTDCFEAIARSQRPF